MGWINPKDKMPPKGLWVLVEASGIFNAPYSLISHHGFYIGAWIVPEGETEGHWLLEDSCRGCEYHMIEPEVHAWMPLPKHYKGDGDGGGMEHAMFEDDPGWLYKDGNVYEPQTLEEIGCNR